LNNFRTSPFNSLNESRPSTHMTGIYICSRIQKRLDSRFLAVFGSQHQGRPASTVRSVNRRPLCKQGCNNINPPFFRRDS
jgi:hypothetical protein